MSVAGERNPEVMTLHRQADLPHDDHRPLMNSADVFSLEFDMLTRTSALARTLDAFRGDGFSAATHRQLLLEVSYVINVHSRLREVAADVVPPEDWSAWQELLGVPALGFEQGRLFLDDLRVLGLNSVDSVSLTPLPQT